MDSPCKDCDERAVGCHSLCEQYKEFVEECERVRQKRRQDHAIEDCRRCYATSSVNKRREYFRRKLRK